MGDFLVKHVTNAVIKQLRTHHLQFVNQVKRISALFMTTSLEYHIIAHIQLNLGVRILFHLGEVTYSVYIYIYIYIYLFVILNSIPLS